MASIFYDVSLLLLYSVVGPQKAALEDALRKAKFFQGKRHVSRVERGRGTNTRKFTGNTYITFKNGKKVTKTVPK